jgi:O-antigen ligase
METFAQENGVREASAQSRLDLWRDCMILLAEDPVMGCGPDHWPLHAHEFGWPAGKEAHSLWVQTLVELGIPGFLMYTGFFLTVLFRCWYMLQKTLNDEDAWFADSARMTIASIIGFMVSAQFVSLEALEIPYYVALLGAGSLVVHARTVQAAQTSVSDAAASATESVNHAFVAAPIHEAAVAFEPISEIPQRRYMNRPINEQPADPVFIAPAPVVESVRIRDWRDTVGREVGAIMN